MNFEAILADKSLKAKQKTEVLAQGLLNADFTLDSLLEFAGNGKDSEKAACLEATEYASKVKPTIASEKLLTFVTDSLTAMAPRIKWESAKVIGNIAHLYPKKLEKVIGNLLNNTEHKGTVVRWSAAFALSKILILKTKHTKDLLSVINSILIREEQNSIKKLYLVAIKKLQNA